MTAVLTDAFSSTSKPTPIQGSESTPQAQPPSKQVSATGERLKPGFGPPRPAFRCARPSSCEGPHYVSFNSYFNNPVTGDERPFFAALDTGGAEKQVSDSLSLSGKPTELVMHAYIDNNTYQSLPELPTTDALDTRLRLALPSEPVYEANPTAYLEASNARPKVIWDTVTVRSLNRPVALSYVRGSTRLTVAGDDGRSVTRTLGNGLGDPGGLSLGNWKADFRYAGYVTFRVKAQPVPEPVRDPRLTRAIGEAVIYPAAAGAGVAKEPVYDSAVGDRFTCGTERCKGPPFPELNAYLNHPLLGDEADFVRGALAFERTTEGVEHYRTVALVQPGDELKVRIAIDNGGDPAAIGAPPPARLTARDVRARVALPARAARELTVSAELTSTSTRPRRIADTLPVRSRRPIRLVLRPETAAISAGSLRLAPRNLFAVGGSSASAAPRPGIAIGDISASFSKVVYIQFYLRVVPGSG